MAKDKMYGKTLRKNFARHEEIMEMPNLLELQKKSYRWFLDEGLQEVFTDVASITNYAGNLELSFIGYKMDEAPKYDVEECKARDATYAAPLKVNVRLYNNQTQEIKEQEIFMGDFPLMTQSGTFVINGAERVVVSQIVRSPGVYYGKEIDLKTDLPLLTSTVIPYRGAWLEYETDTNEVFWVRIDKNRKIPITELIRAIGEYRKEEHPRITGYEFHVIQLVSQVCPHRLILPYLAETLEELKTREPELKFPFRARVVLVGSEIDDPEFTKLIETCGAMVVADRYCFGSFPGREQIEIREGETAFDAICRHYLHWNQCARFMDGMKIDQRHSEVKKLADEFKADGVIYENMKFCEFWSYEKILAHHIFTNELGIPTCTIEKEYALGAVGQLRTRFQAFIESLEIKQIQGGK